MTEEELRKEKERLIKADIGSIENRVRHAFNQGYELAYQQGLEDGKRQGVAIDGDKRYWDGYHAAQEDGQKIYQKGLDAAWTAARKIVLDDCLSCVELYDIFEDEDPYRILEAVSASEAVEKIQEYEEKQEQEKAKERIREKLESGYFSGNQNQKDKVEIKVGTKVRTTKEYDHFGTRVFSTGTVGTVTEIDQDIQWYKVSANGHYWWYSSDMFEVIGDEKQERDCDTCARNTRPWLSEECYGCTESDSHYVLANDPTEKKSE